MAGCEALNHKSIDLEHNNQILKARRDLTIQELHKLDIAIDPPKGAFFVWFPIPKGESSLDFTTRLILETGVVTFPGIGYGENGEGYIRISFTQDLPLLAEAFKRIKKYFNNFEHKHICSGNVGNKQDGVLKLRS
jgi:LL-diaminopimelate aminotransferase